MILKEDLNFQEAIEKEVIEAFHQERCKLREEATAAIAKTQSENKRTYNRKRKVARKYKIGDWVAIQRTQSGPSLKLHPKFLGIYHTKLRAFSEIIAT